MNKVRADKIDVKQVLSSKINTYYNAGCSLTKVHLDVIREKVFHIITQRASTHSRT